MKGFTTHEGKDMYHGECIWTRLKRDTWKDSWGQKINKNEEKKKKIQQQQKMKKKNWETKKKTLPHQPYSFFGSCLPNSCQNGKILNDTFRVDSFASTGFSATGV